MRTRHQQFRDAVLKWGFTNRDNVQGYFGKCEEFNPFQELPPHVGGFATDKKDNVWTQESEKSDIDDDNSLSNSNNANKAPKGMLIASQTQLIQFSGDSFNQELGGLPLHEMPLHHSRVKRTPKLRHRHQHQRHCRSPTRKPKTEEARARIQRRINHQLRAGEHPGRTLELSQRKTGNREAGPDRVFLRRPGEETGIAEKR